MQDAVTKSAFSEKYTLFRQLLIEARQAKNLTQAQVAERLGGIQSFVSKYESGERRLDIVEFLEIANALDIPSYEILRRLENQDTILDRWEISAERLTQIVDNNPSLRGTLIGYIAETKLREIWFSGSQTKSTIKHDDHDRKNKYDLLVGYKEHTFRIESKSLQTSSVKAPKHPGERWRGSAQCDASDRRPVKFPDGSSVETTCLIVNDFDVLAVNLFAFENQWRFIFAKNSDLERSKSSKYTPDQQKFLLKGSIKVSFPPEPPFREEPFSLFDEIIEEKESMQTEQPEIIVVSKPSKQLSFIEEEVILEVKTDEAK